jgi:TolB-like protein/AraC-like DNA-binding protein
MSRSTLHRRIHSLTGKSAGHFIREYRLKSARELLQDSGMTVSEVAYWVGFSSATYFSTCFRKQFGYPPGKVVSNGPGGPNAPDSHPDKAAGDRTRIRIPVPWVISSLVFIAAAILLIIAFKPFSGKHPDQQYAIAVLPIHNDSPGNENDYILNSLMDEILTKLSSLEELAVVSRTTSEVYRDSDKSLPQIARELQVDYVLEGSATLLNHQTRIRLQLIKGATDTHVWSEPYERVITEGNLFRVQEDVALVVARELNLVLKPRQQKEIERKPTENMEAYQAYLLAKELLERNPLRYEEITHSQSIRVKQLLERAIALDSGLCEAYASLGSLYLYNLYKLENEGYSEKAYALLDSGLYCAEKVQQELPGSPSLSGLGL